MEESYLLEEVRKDLNLFKPTILHTYWKELYLS